MITRTAEQIRNHYEIEKELANKLRLASKDERSKLYSQVYDELFSSVPDHPQLTEKSTPEENRKRTLGQFRFLEPLLTAEDTYLEIGPGTCELARHVATKVKHVYAADVSDVVAQGASFPDNMDFVLSDGTNISVPENSIDLAFSNQLMEHLHPDDAIEQLQEIYKALKPDGRYLCITPSRLSGPHDVSGYFEQEASCLHLKEYGYKEIWGLFQAAGFRNFSIIIGYRGWGVRTPLSVGRFVETIVECTPASIRRVVARIPPIRLALGIKLIATK